MDWCSSRMATEHLGQPGAVGWVGSSCAEVGMFWGALDSDQEGLPLPLMAEAFSP